MWGAGASIPTGAWAAAGSEAMSARRRRDRRETSSRRISGALTGFGRHEHLRPAGLEVVSSGRGTQILLENLMQTWGAHCGYTQGQILEAVRDHSLHADGSLRFSTVEEAGHIAIQVYPRRERRERRGGAVPDGSQMARSGSRRISPDRSRTPRRGSARASTDGDSTDVPEEPRPGAGVLPPRAADIEAAVALRMVDAVVRAARTPRRR